MNLHCTGPPFLYAYPLYLRMYIYVLVINFADLSKHVMQQSGPKFNKYNFHGRGGWLVRGRRR